MSLKPSRGVIAMKYSSRTLAVLAVCAACSSNKPDGNTIGGSDITSTGGANSGSGGALFSSGGSSGSTGFGNGGADGGGKVCKGQDFAAEALPVDMYIMFDQSSSMGTSYPGANPPTTWWAVAQQAVEGFVNNPQAAGIGVGIQYFPLGGVDPQSCPVSLYQTPDVPVALLPGNAAALTKSIQSHVPEAFTPTIPALTGAVNYMKTWGPAHAGRQPVVVLVTDGYPTECPAMPDITDVANVAKDAYNGDPKILTFVVGFADEGGLDNLDQIAAAGGTGKSFQITGGDLGSQFTNAMLSIATTPLSCSFDVPTSSDPANPISTDLVSVHFISAATKIDTEVPKVNGLGGCMLNNNVGWYFDDPSTPKKVLICPGTCSSFSAGSISIRYGCAPIVPITN